ncbi:hypothetical protein KJ969_03940 [Patescibacteria group bacterium]|nr:hypothetical protein [Patescibacteria group bacterium]MBU1921816.1 hypothetical protein [Patescibacteria group bacterium]
MKLLLRLIQIIIILSPLLLLAWLFNLNFVPSGVLARGFDFSRPSPYVDYLVPAERVTGVQSGDGERFQEILQDPVYFHAHLPSNFDELTVGLKFKPDEQTLLEFGPMMNEEAWQYDLRPLWNELIEELNWPYVEEGGARLYQKNANFSSVSEFLNNMPALDRVGVYDYDLKTDFQVLEYAAMNEAREYEIYLRGYHQFLTYIGDGERLDYTFYIQDMNRGEGADPVVINLYKENVLVESLIIPDGELWRGEHEGSKVREIKFVKDFLTSGVYKIEFKVPADIFIRKIKTPQQKLVIINTVFLGDEVGYRESEKTQELFTNSNYVMAETFHADGTQNLETSGGVIRVSESHREFYKEFESTGELARVYSPQGDIKITGNGLFAWDRGLYFNPYPIKLDANSDLDRQGVDYLITGYKPAQKIGDWYVAEQTFDLAPIPKDYGTIKFSISAPGVSRRQAAPAIAEINLRFEREEITWENGYEIIKKYFYKALGRVL